MAQGGSTGAAFDNPPRTVFVLYSSRYGDSETVEGVTFDPEVAQHWENDRRPGENPDDRDEVSYTSRPFRPANSVSDVKAAQHEQDVEAEAQGILEDLKSRDPDVLEALEEDLGVQLDGLSR